MADHKKQITLTDVNQKILSNDLYNDQIDGGMKWIQDGWNSKVRGSCNCKNNQIN